MIRSFNHLKGVLGYSVDELEAVLSNKTKNSYHFKQSKGMVKGVEKFRHFNPSRRTLRDVQNRIKDRIFRQIALPDHVHGCVTKKGNITNSRVHQGKHYKLHTDLKSYFDFVTNRAVNQSLLKLGFSPDVANLLTRLTTFEGHLAQGPPTSPFLANIAALEMDNELLDLCRQHEIFYTRFVDDLCFSSQADFKELIPQIVAIINKYGFFIGYKKTKYKEGRIEITGVNIGQNNLLPTKKQIEKFSDPATPEWTRKGLAIYFAGMKPKKKKSAKP